MAMVPKLAMAMITFGVCMSAMAGGGWCRESVTITNMLAMPLEVQCHSRNDMLAEQTLAFDAVYEFHFHKNIFGTTLFTCDFRADVFGHLGIKVWEGFWYADRKVSCTQCRWDVTPQGFKCNGHYIYAWSA